MYTLEIDTGSHRHRKKIDSWEHFWKEVVSHIWWEPTFRVLGQIAGHVAAWGFLSILLRHTRSISLWQLMIRSEVMGCASSSEKSLLSSTDKTSQLKISQKRCSVTSKFTYSNGQFSLQGQSTLLNFNSTFPQHSITMPSIPLHPGHL